MTCGKCRIEFGIWDSGGSTSSRIAGRRSSCHQVETPGRKMRCHLGHEAPTPGEYLPPPLGLVLKMVAEIGHHTSRINDEQPNTPAVSPKDDSLLQRRTPQEGVGTTPEPKSRWSVPGHQDPDTEDLHVYAPTLPTPSQLSCVYRYWCVTGMCCK